MFDSKNHYISIVATLLLLASLHAKAADPTLLMNVMQCESSLRYSVWGDDGKSFGIAQFRKETFYEFAAMARKEMKAENLWPARWENPQHQAFLMNWGIDHGYGNRWTCYRKITKEAEYSRKMVAYRPRKADTSLKFATTFNETAQ
jgi:hypothetical protein